MNRFEFYSAKREYEEKQNFLKHYGTKGQKWGERHWQNYDGTFNEAGKERYFGKSSKNSSEDYKVSGLFNKNLSKEKKDKIREKLYSRDSEMLTIDKLYNEDEQKYLLNKEVSKKVNKLVDCLTKGDFDKYNKILENVDSEHLQTVKNAAYDLANTKQLRNVNSSKLTELSKDIFGNDNILGVERILAMTNTNDNNAHSENRVYPVDIRQSIIDNSALLKNAILEYEKGYINGYERDIEIASGGDERRTKYMKQFVNDIEAIKEYSKDSKEINNEIRKLKTKESCDDNAFINYRYTDSAYNNIYKYIDDDFPTRLKKGTNDAKKVANNLYKNFEKYSKEFKENLYYQLLDYYNDEYISKSEFMKEIGKINAVDMYGNGNVTFTYSVPGEMGYDVVSINGNINDNGKLIINDADFID